MQSKLKNKHLVSWIVKFEMVALNSRLYRERILVVVYQYVNKRFQDFRHY